MAKQLQLRRGTKAQNDVFTGASGELSVDTENHRVRLHDGAKQGGYLVGSSDICMPSTTSTNPTIPSNGGTVIAPADGWFILVRQSTGSGQLVRLMGRMQAEMTSHQASQNLRVVLPVTKGETVTVGYSSNSTANLFRFYYANGSAWEK